MKIKSARIRDFKVYVTLEDGTNTLLCYLNPFTKLESKDILGMTISEALALKHQRNKEAGYEDEV